MVSSKYPLTLYKPISVIKPKTSGTFFAAYNTKLIHKKPPMGLAVYHRHITINKRIAINMKIAAVMRHNPVSLAIRPFMRLSENGSLPLWVTFAHSNSDYELYLQKTMMRNVYNMYREFTSYARQLRDSPLAFITGRRISDLGDMVFKRFSEQVHRHETRGNAVKQVNVHINYPNLIPRQAIPGNAEIRQMPEARPETRVESIVQADRHVEKELTSLQPDNTYSLNVNMVLDRVYSGIEDVLKRQRLKKGLW